MNLFIFGVAITPTLDLIQTTIFYVIYNLKIVKNKFILNVHILFGFVEFIQGIDRALL